jgi:Zn-dependent protease with chaperone function
MRVNGLYGHVRKNDVRSVALFAGFVAAFHFLAVLALVVPLAMFDPGHAPFYGWTGYLVRWVPILTIAGAVLFAVQMAWHVRTVRSRTDFRFVDDQDEPRLCRIVEPLAIAAGLPLPYVGVIDIPALNAFACGIRQKDAVLVFTRGLVDGLDDDELAAVAAHEIVHVVNGDIRLIAATNVCLDTLKLLQQRRSTRRANRIWEAFSVPLLALALPLLFVLLLLVCFLRRLAVDGAHLTRLLIASAREFMADAEAVRLTQNPAALVSALRRIEGRSVIPGLAAGQDAMMIDGAHEGAFATHPTISERVAALVAVTGSMALIAPARRDTRPQALAAASGFGRRPGTTLESACGSSARRSASIGSVRASAAEGFNRLGLTREMTVGAVAACGVLVWVHGANLGNPSAIAAALDPAPLRTIFEMGGKGMSCQVRGIGSLLGMGEMPTDCDQGSIEGIFAAHRGEGNILGMIADQRAGVHERAAGLRERPDGTFGNVAPAEARLAEVQSRRCFHTERYSVGDRGLHSVNERPADGDTISLSRWLAHGESMARAASEASPAQRDAALLDYFKSRKAHGETIHRFFGDPGLQAAQMRYGGPAHQNAIAVLRGRLTDPQFVSGLSPLERAEIELLAANPLDFLTCTARRGRAVPT